jgi:hypothetical protein
MTTLLSAGIFICGLSVCAQEKVVWSDQERPIVEQIRGLLQETGTPFLTTLRSV